MTFGTHAIFYAVAALALTGCASFQAPCPAGHDARQRVDLYFGRNIGDRLGVSEQDFEAFVEQEVSPRFPDGLTITDGQGRWRGGDKTIVREPSKVITLVVDGTAEVQAHIDAIRAAYKARFKQEAVMEIASPACVGF